MSKIVRSIKNVANGYSSSQVKVRNATSNEESGPMTFEMQELAELTFQNHELFLIMDMLDKRLNDKGKNWRHVLKSLTVLDYLVHYGSDNVIIWCRENLYIIKTLREFQHRDDSGRDMGVAIRDRAKDLTSLIMDTERLRKVRADSRGNGRRRRRPRRHYNDDYDSQSTPDRYRSKQPREDMDDDEMRRAIELSKQSAEEDERRRAQQQSVSSEDVQKAIQMSQNDAQAPWNGNLIDTSDSLYYQQPQLDNVNTGYLQYTGLPYSEQDLQQYRYAQQQFQMQQEEMQRQYLEQQAQLEAQAQAQAQAQQQFYLSQQQQQQQQPQQQEPLEPLKTGSNNPFAAFNQNQNQSAPTRPAPPRRQNTFDKGHMDHLNHVLSLEVPADTFGNTGSARIPAQHTANSFVNSAGHAMTSTPTGSRATGTPTGSGTNNPFVGSQYTGIASTQMQPAHTGFGFGNANASRSSTNLIDL